MLVCYNNNLRTHCVCLMYTKVQAHKSAHLFDCLCKRALLCLVVVVVVCNYVRVLISLLWMQHTQIVIISINWFSCLLLFFFCFLLLIYAMFYCELQKWKKNLIKQFSFLKLHSVFNNFYFYHFICNFISFFCCMHVKIWKCMHAVVFSTF